MTDTNTTGQPAANNWAGKSAAQIVADIDNLLNAMRHAQDAADSAADTLVMSAKVWWRILHRQARTTMTRRGYRRWRGRRKGRAIAYRRAD